MADVEVKLDLAGIESFKKTAPVRAMIKEQAEAAAARARSMGLYSADAHLRESARMHGAYGVVSAGKDMDNILLRSIGGKR